MSKPPIKEKSQQPINKYKRTYSKYEKAEKVQKLEIPTFECLSSYFTTWHASSAVNYTTKDGLKLSRVPYPELTLLLHSNDSRPTQHFSEIITYFRQNKPKKAIYIHSGPVYAVLVMAASTSADVSIIISHEYPDKDLILTSFVLNNIRDKAYFEGE